MSKLNSISEQPLILTNEEEEPLQKKIDRAVRLLKVTCSDLDEVELCYSGGKDSDVILELAKMAGIPYRAIYKQTTIDPPGTIRHCREKGVEIRKPKMTFFQLIEKNGLPSRFSRFCCSVLKEYKILDNAIQGIRRCESTKRAKRYKEPTACRFYGSKKNHVNVIYPILDWTDEDVEEFVNTRRIKCHPLYYDEQGKFHVERRLGCIGCPLQSDRGVSDLKKYPKFLKAQVNAVRKWWDKPRKTELASKAKFKDVYELVLLNKFFDTYEDFKLATDNPFGKMDCKAELEKYFKIEL